MRMLTILIPLVLAAGIAAAAPAPTPATGRPPVAAPAPADAPPIKPTEIEKLFPGQPVQADVMEVATPPRYQAIRDKMRAALVKDPAWWQEYSKLADEHGIVPWHEKMGITKAEYEEMLTLARGLKLSRVASTTLTFKHGADGAITVDGGAKAAELTGLKFSRDRMSVGGTYGDLLDREDVHQVDAAAPSGVWHGIKWSSRPAATGSGEYKLAFLAMGRLSPSNRGLMFLSVRQIAGGKRSERARIVSYPIAAP